MLVFGEHLSPQAQSNAVSMFVLDDLLEQTLNPESPSAAVIPACVVLLQLLSA
jgi:hypothetical protein